MSLSKLKKALPWWAKIASKVVLARLPFSYRIWKAIGLFEHGQMQSVKYAEQTFKAHYERAGSPRNFVGLELGPGDSLLSVLVASKYGADKTYLVDAGNFANSEVDLYRQAEQQLYSNDENECRLQQAASIEGICQQYSAAYLTEGLHSLKEIESDSVDFVWSQAVLEHVRKHEFLETMREINRILKPTGLCSHDVDLKDHLGGALNNLRFSEKNWESNFMTSSGFYTNRIRFSSMLELFQQADFEVEVVEQRTWPSLPTPLNKIHADYQSLGEQELLSSGFIVILKPIAS